MKLKTLNKKLNKARLDYLGAIDEIVVEICNLTGCSAEEIMSNDFPDDGLGISHISEMNGEVYAPIEKLINLLEKNKKLTIDDIIDNTSL